MLDDITLYWVTNTGISAGRLYWENKLNLYAAADFLDSGRRERLSGESYQAPRSWTELAYHKLIYYDVAAEGGHYAGLGTAATLFTRGSRGLQSLRS